MVWSPETDANSSPEEHPLHRLLGSRVGVYQIESLLGRGGMGWVFLSRHGDLQRLCALKILDPELAGTDPDFLMRFQNEGRSAAALVHPNIVTTHAIGQHEQLHFLEMEYVRGRSLQAEIEAGPLAEMRCLTLAAGIANGLAAAHREGILHRDLKPDNILLTHRGIPKISDFGLAKRIAHGITGTSPQMLAGTPHYMAPELFLGAPHSTQSDVYALGVCLFVMLTGRLPFTRCRLAELIESVTNDPLPSLRDSSLEISLEAAECVCLLLSRAPRNRPRDGIEAAQLIQAILGYSRDLEEMMHLALDDEPGITWHRNDQRYTAEVELPNGRRQYVFIESSNPSKGDRVLSIYSICGPADQDHYRHALQLNADILHGALAIRNWNGVPHFVMLNNYPRSTVDAEEVRRSVIDAAIHADELEQKLTGGDQH